MAEQLTVQRATAEVLFEELQTNQRPVVINALSEEAYIAERIPGSISIPAENADRINNIIPDKDQDIVVYCANADCQASAQLAETLIDKGYSRVRDFEEGLAGWKEQGYNLVGHDVN